MFLLALTTQLLGNQRRCPWAPNAKTSSAIPAVALHLHTAARVNTRSQVSRV